MNLPRRHHTNPRFYLDRWSGRDKQVCAMRLIRGVIKPRRFHPQIMRDHDREEADTAARPWAGVGLSRTETSLLASARPMVFGDLANPDAYIALPLGPYDLFIAATDDRFERQLPLKNPSKVTW